MYSAISRSDPIRGSRAVVTGAGSGLGRALALELVRRGGTVIAVGRREAPLRETAHLAAKSGIQTGAVLPFPSDVTDERSAVACREEAVHRLGGVDILVCNAGMSIKRHTVLSYEDVARTMQVNFLSVVRWIEEMLPLLEASHVGGHIVTISSLGDCYGLPYSNGYNPSKAALTIFSECLRADLQAGGSRIVVTNVRPGFMDTAMAGAQRFKPFTVSPTQAANIILDAVARGRPRVSFPRAMTLAATLLTLLPKSLLAWVGRQLVSHPWGEC